MTYTNNRFYKISNKKLGKKFCIYQYKNGVFYFCKNSFKPSSAYIWGSKIYEEHIKLFTFTVKPLTNLEKINAL